MAEFQHLDRSSSYGANLPAWVYATPDVASCLHVICVSVSQPTLNIYRVFMHIPYTIVPKCQTVKGLKKHRSFAELLKPWKFSVSHGKLQSRCCSFPIFVWSETISVPSTIRKRYPQKNPCVLRNLPSFLYIYIHTSSCINVKKSYSPTVKLKEQCQ